MKELLRRFYVDEIALAIWHTRRRLFRELKRGFGHTDRRLLAHYLRDHPTRKLHLGCGIRELDGWLNTDMLPVSTNVLQLDVTRPFPMQDECLDYVYSEHVIEHITYADGQRMLSECFRLLKPGGVIRTSTPDLAFVLKVYQGEPTGIVREYLDFYTDKATPWAPGPEGVFYLNNFVRDWGHQFIYDEPTLRALLGSVGFVDVRPCELNQSEHEPLCNLEHETRMPEGYLKLETMTLEARKPG